MVNDLADELTQAAEVDAFNPDARMAARSIFEAQERVFKLVPRILEAIRRPVPADVADLVKRFSEPFDGMLSEIIQCHQLRSSAAIMDIETARETGWADTSDRAEHMRKAAATIEALTTLASGRDEARGEPVAWMYEHPEGYRNYTSRSDMRDSFEGWIETPLYALPTPPQGDQQ